MPGGLSFAGVNLSTLQHTYLRVKFVLKVPENLLRNLCTTPLTKKLEMLGPARIFGNSVLSQTSDGGRAHPRLFERGKVGQAGKRRARDGCTDASLGLLGIEGATSCDHFATEQKLRIW